MNIPSNFDVRRYSKVRPTANAWSSNLQIRWGMINALNEGDNEGVIKSLTNFYTQPFSYEPPISNEGSAFDYPSWAVVARPLIVEDAYQFKHALLGIINDEFYSTSSEIPEIGYESIGRLAPHLDGVQNHYKLNLNAPDDIIIESVMKAVAHARKELGIKPVLKRFSGDKYQTWQKQLLLPYLDLKIWLRATNKTMINRNIARALWKSSDDKGKLDRTISSAKMLFGKKLNERTYYLEALTVQGVQEDSENIAVHECETKGMGAKKIARRLGLDESTVKMHLKYRS